MELFPYDFELIWSLDSLAKGKGHSITHAPKKKKKHMHLFCNNYDQFALFYCQSGVREHSKLTSPTGAPSPHASDLKTLIEQ